MANGFFAKAAEKNVFMPAWLFVRACVFLCFSYFFTHVCMHVCMYVFIWVLPSIRRPDIDPQ